MTKRVLPLGEFRVHIPSLMGSALYTEDHVFSSARVETCQPSCCRACFGHVRSQGEAGWKDHGHHHRLARTLIRKSVSSLRTRTAGSDRVSPARVGRVRTRTARLGGK